MWTGGRSADMPHGAMAWRRHRVVADRETTAACLSAAAWPLYNFLSVTGCADPDRLRAVPSPRRIAPGARYP
jgi:hypothetical protein